MHTSCSVHDTQWMFAGSWLTKWIIVQTPQKIWLVSSRGSGRSGGGSRGGGSGGGGGGWGLGGRGLHNG